MVKWLKVPTEAPNRVTANDETAIAELQATETRLKTLLERIVEAYPGIAPKSEEMLEQLRSAWAKFDIVKANYLSGTHEEEIETTFNLEEFEDLLNDIENFTFGQ